MESQLIIFDLDGTLIDSRRDLAVGVNHMRTHYGFSLLSEDTVCSYIGDGVRRLVERALEGAEVDIDEALRINKEFYFSHLTVHTYLYEGVSEGLLQLVKAGHTLAVLTNKPGDPSRAILKHFGLEDLFSSVVGGGDVGRLKPAPDGLFRCLTAAQMDASQAWMVGDHHTDLAVAQNAGVKSAFVRYGFGEERGVEPDVYFASFSELVGYFV